jgi:hypothetical protein
MPANNQALAHVTAAAAAMALACSYCFCAGKEDEVSAQLRRTQLTALQHRHNAFDSSDPMAERSEELKVKAREDCQGFEPPTVFVVILHANVFIASIYSARLSQLRTSAQALQRRAAVVKGAEMRISIISSAIFYHDC